MKTTLDIPDNIFERTRIAAEQRQTTCRDLIIQGLEMILRDDAKVPSPKAADALERLQKGYHLGNSPLNREKNHAR